jgi:hypothetical protein
MRVILWGIIGLTIMALFMLKRKLILSEAKFKASDFIALVAALSATIISLLSLGWTISENVRTSEKLKLIDRPKITFSSNEGVYLLPYKTETAEYFRSQNWGIEKP